MGSLYHGCAGNATIFPKKDGTGENYLLDLYKYGGIG